MGEAGPFCDHAASHKAKRQRLFWVGLVALAAFALFLELGRMDIVSDNEGQRAAPPVEMLERGDYIVPTLNDATYLAKPPLLYWAIAAVYWLTGSVSEFTARVPTALCAMGLVLSVYFFVRRSGNENAARWSACLTLASPYILERARLAQLDVPLAFMVFLACIALWAALRARRAGRYTVLVVASGIALGLAILLKGPTPFLFVVPAWLAHLVLSSEDAGRSVRIGLIWSAIGFGIDVVLKTVAAGLGLWIDYASTASSVDSAALGVLPFAQRIARTPLGLALVAVAWSCVALRFAPGRRLRSVLTLAGVSVLGACVAAPWAVAVLQRLGWPYIDNLLHTEVLDRVHTATAINSGSSFYYLIALPILLAPWGFLLPLHLSKGLWKDQPAVARLAGLLGWISVLLYSLIAGKEYEYILPAMPFLLIPTGFHLAAFNKAAPARWLAAYRAWWLRTVVPLLTVLAVGGAVYVAVEQPVPALLAECLVFAVAVVALTALAIRRPSCRLPSIFLASLFVVMAALLSRAYHYTGDRSPKVLAETAGHLSRQGFRVEAWRVPPPFAFYARTPIPLNRNQEEIAQRLARDEPYFYLVPERYMDLVFSQTDRPTEPLMRGRLRSTAYGLIGNVEMPAPLR